MLWPRGCHDHPSSWRLPGLALRTRPRFRIGPSAVSVHLSSRHQESPGPTLPFLESFIEGGIEDGGLLEELGFEAYDAPSPPAALAARHRNDAELIGGGGPRRRGTESQVVGHRIGEVPAAPRASKDPGQPSHFQAQIVEPIRLAAVRTIRDVVVTASHRHEAPAG